MSAERALVVGSGMAALDVITRLLRPGDEVVTGDDLYGGTNRLLKYLADNAGIIVHHVDTTNTETVRRVLGPRTAMVLLESPTNPLIKIVDIRTIAAQTHEANPNALVAMDNTMLSPLLFNPLDLGADIVYESGTKYLSGHHDLMAGVLAVNSSALGEKLYFTINASGCGLSPFDSWLLMRGIKTLKVRLEQQQLNAQRIAEFLESHGFKVRYPGLKSHPQYDLHHSMARGSGAVLSFETGDQELSERIVAAAKLWTISVSFGCVNSLISMPCKMSHASIDAKTRKERALPEDIIRLCVGIEDADDLIDDLSTAVSLSIIICSSVWYSANHDAARSCRSCAAQNRWWLSCQIEWSSAFLRRHIDRSCHCWTISTEKDLILPVHNNLTIFCPSRHHLHNLLAELIIIIQASDVGKASLHMIIFLI